MPYKIRKKPSEPPYRTFIKNCIAGTVGGIAITIVGHPFDTIKVRLQTQDMLKPIYTGPLDCVLKTLKKEGIPGLYKGVGSPLAGQMFFRAILFSSYGYFTRVLKTKYKKERLSIPQFFIAGACSGFVLSYINCPIELFKTKIQIQILQFKNPIYKNVFHCAYEIIKTHGLRGPYQGLGATMLRDIPAFGLYFAIYEFICNQFATKDITVKDLKPWNYGIAGGTSGLLLWILIFPLDVIKSAMQSDDSNFNNRKYKNVFQCINKLYTMEGGISRFYKGFLPGVLRAIPANGAAFVAFEYAKKHLDRF